MFLDGHASDNGTDFDLLVELWREHFLDVVFDLEGKFSGRTDHQGFDRVKDVILVAWFFEAFDQDVKDWKTESKCFTLASLGSNNHVYVLVKEH